MVAPRLTILPGARPAGLRRTVPKTLEADPEDIPSARR